MPTCCIHVLNFLHLLHLLSFTRLFPSPSSNCLAYYIAFFHISFAFDFVSPCHYRVFLSVAHSFVITPFSSSLFPSSLITLVSCSVLLTHHYHSPSFPHLLLFFFHHHHQHLHQHYKHCHHTLNQHHYSFIFIICHLHHTTPHHTTPHHNHHVSTLTMRTEHQQ